jgi:hypothetical protein
MKLTNKFNLPQTFVNVIKRPQYTKGDSQISATEIINSPRIVQLKAKHWDDIEQDASEMVWSLFGSAVHGILEHGKDDHHIVEERLFCEFEGWKISGAIDLQEVEEDGIIVSDYKVTGAWAVMNVKADWENQLNIYAWFVEKVKQTPVKKLQIIAIVRDWAARDVNREGYPSSPVATVDIPLWSQEKREAYIKGRLSLHNDAYFATHAGDDMPECTAEEMWEKQTTYAVKKIGGVRAKSVHKTDEEAQEALSSIKDAKNYAIEAREGERTRCQNYCQAAPFCDQFKNYLANKPTKE